MKKLLTGVVGGVLMIIVTLLFSVIILKDAELEAMHFVALGGIIFAELCWTGIVYYARNNPRRMAATGTSIITVVFSILLAIIYINAFSDAFLTYFCWYFIGVIVLNAVAIALFIFDAKRTSESKELANAKENILNMRKVVKLIMTIPAAADYEKELEALEDKLHFSNDSIVCESDSAIMNMLLGLKTNIGTPGFDTNTAIENINSAIDRINILGK